MRGVDGTPATGEYDRMTLVRILPLLALLPLTGCMGPQRVVTPERMKTGLVLILPGIEGEGIWSGQIVRGLEQGDVKCAIEVYDWTVAPGALVVNLTTYERNLREARRVADRIVEYRERHPGAPVYLIGHSGGAGLAVFALEQMPPGRRVDLAVLLAPAVSPDHDLTKALLHTRQGIYNFFSEKDVALLKVGTSVVGPMDRNYGPSAGAIGFNLPNGLTSEGRQLYKRKLHQIRWEPYLKEYGATGSHIGWASTKFAKTYLSKIVSEDVSRLAAHRVQNALEAGAPSSAEASDERNPEPTLQVGPR